MLGPRVVALILLVIRNTCEIEEPETSCNWEPHAIEGLCTRAVELVVVLRPRVVGEVAPIVWLVTCEVEDLQSGRGIWLRHDDGLVVVPLCWVWLSGPVGRVQERRELGATSFPSLSRTMT